MQTPESRRDQLQGLAGWLIIVPIVLAILFGCGQLALLGGAPARRLDTSSKLTADYAAWEYVIIPPVSTAIVQEALRDQARETPGAEPAEITPVVTALAFWPTTPAPISNISPTPSATPTDTPPPASPTAFSVPIDTDTPAPTLTVPPTDTETPPPSAFLRQSPLRAT